MNNDAFMTNIDLANPHSVIHNFDVSVIMPFYKKLDEFKLVLPLNAHFFQRNGIEVIISMDEDSQQKGLLLLLKEYPFINWRVIINHNKHEWRNPAKAINVGIKHALKKYVMICSPESEFYTDAIHLMRNSLEYYEHHFAIGSVTFDYCEDISKLNFDIPYGSIMAKKSDLIDIGGYNESLYKWGGDDDNIRARLELAGIQKIFLPEVKLIHRDKDVNGQKKRSINMQSILPEEELDIFYPNEAKVNEQEWGRDFNHVIYDWRHNPLSYEIAEKYLSNFERFYIKDPKIFSREYSRIIIAQSFNEQEQIADFLNDMGLYFDGIILLDDGSSDDTFELASHPKLLLKVKKNRIGFIDIENRNILLDLASFFSSEWFCFMDTDERFDERFVDFDKATLDEKTDIVLFNFVHLWDSDKTYNAEYPYSKNGILEKPRMFRNIGHTQIYTNKVRTHFMVIPHQKNCYRSEIFYKHYGMISQKLREEKYTFYQEEDINKDQKSYEHIIKKNPLLLNTDDICCQNGIFCNKQIEREINDGLHCLS